MTPSRAADSSPPIKSRPSLRSSGIYGDVLRKLRRRSAGVIWQYSQHGSDRKARGNIAIRLPRTRQTSVFLIGATHRVAIDHFGRLPAERELIGLVGDGEAADVTEVLGVRKWEPPLPMGLGG